MLSRYKKQNQLVSNTITASDIDKQQTSTTLAKQNMTTLESQLKTKQVDVEKAKLAIEKAQLNTQTKKSQLKTAEQQLAKAKWDLDSTDVYAPADGFVTNFMLFDRANWYLGYPDCRCTPMKSMC